jgi:hypothetical protein
MEDEELQAEISKAIDMIQSVLDSANDAIDKEHLASAVVDLANRVDDWKALKVEGFGDLLRFGTFTVLKGDSTKDTEREVGCLPILDDPLQFKFRILQPSLRGRVRLTSSFRSCNSTTSTFSNAFYSAAKTSIPTSRSPNSWATRTSPRQPRRGSCVCS